MKNKNKSKAIKGIAISQVALLVLEIFAFGFIMGGMAVLNSGIVRAQTTSIRPTYTIGGITDIKEEIISGQNSKFYFKDSLNNVFIWTPKDDLNGGSWNTVSSNIANTLNLDAMPQVTNLQTHYRTSTGELGMTIGLTANIPTGATRLTYAEYVTASAQQPASAAPAVTTASQQDYVSPNYQTYENIIQNLKTAPENERITDDAIVQMRDWVKDGLMEQAQFDALSRKSWFGFGSPTATYEQVRAVMAENARRDYANGGYEDGAVIYDVNGNWIERNGNTWSLRDSATNNEYVGITPNFNEFKYQDGATFYDGEGNRVELQNGEWDSIDSTGHQMPLSENPDLNNQYTTDESTFLKYQREAQMDAELLSMQEEVNAMQERWSYLPTSFPGSDGKTYIYLDSAPTSLEDIAKYGWTGESGWYEDEGHGEYVFVEDQIGADNLYSEYRSNIPPAAAPEGTGNLLMDDLNIENLKISSGLASITVWKDGNLYTLTGDTSLSGLSVAKDINGKEILLTDEEIIAGGGIGQIEAKKRIAVNGDLGYYKNYTGLFGNLELGPFVGNMYEGLSWGLGLMVAIKTLSDAGLIKKEYGEPLNKAAFAGIMAYKATYGAIEQLKQTDWYKTAVTDSPTTKWIGEHSQAISSVVGLAVAYYVFADNYEKTKTKEATVEFKCYPWQAPNGGADCNKCNEDSQMPCSEYRCKALGQTCKLLNAGTDEAKCIDASPYDVTSPGIKPWPEVLTAGLSYDLIQQRPAGGGTPGHMTVKGDGVGGCIKAFTPFEFGVITTDEGEVTQPAQCKIDFNHTADFDSMAYFMGNDNLYTEEHSQAFSLPGTDLLNKLYTDSNYSFAIKNDGKYNLYIRCKDGNGNTNEDEFVVNFCIDPTPDSEAPLIKATSIASGSGVRYKQDNVSLQVYTNEPANCRWSRRDASYTNMENNMSCSNQVWQMNADLLYTCSAMLTGIKDYEVNTFYFRCEDINTPPNPMTQSYGFSLKGSQPLTMISVGPNGTQSSATSTATVNLTAKTDNGLDRGKANCYFSTTGEETSYTQFYSTGGDTHSQPLDLTGGSYAYYIKCVDLAGNAVYNFTSFTVYIDKNEPLVLRAYSIENQLKIITNEEATCRYSTDNCNFDLSKTEGVLMPYENSKEHLAPFATDKTYYIKCADKHGNSPQPSVCSFIARSYSITLAENL